MQGLIPCDCPFCGDSSPRQSSYEQGEFRIVQCRECDLWYLSPRLSPQAIEEHYASDCYFEGGETGYDSYASQQRPLRMTFERLLATMTKRGLCGGSVLDVGCGYGYFLQEAENHFSHRAGTDYSQAALDHARRHADAVFLGGAEAIPEESRFDCIVALHVIEHVYEPRDFVAKLFHHLRPGGTLLLAAPDMGSWWRKAMGNRWPSFKYPEHVVYYDKQSLSRLMQSANLVDLGAVPYPHAFPVNLALRKLRLPEFKTFDRSTIWLPATTVSVAGRKPLTSVNKIAA